MNDNDQDGDHACERCGATVEGAGYCCVQGSALALCRSCALPGTEEQNASPSTSPRALEETNATKDRTAALDVGGRLWLSEPVRFAGNGSRVLDEKLMAVAARACGATRASSSDARRIHRLWIEDGSAPCDNDKCRSGRGRGRRRGPGAARGRGGAARDRVEGAVWPAVPPMDTNGRRVSSACLQYHGATTTPMLPDLPPVPIPSDFHVPASRCSSTDMACARPNFPEPSLQHGRVLKTVSRS